jgi:hypothetical protein
MAFSRLARLAFVTSLAVIAAPAVTLAQSAIAGAVSDATGGVLPGVTVEASSPALIEQSRVAITDENGRYRLGDLRPGTYKVTFTLPGFATFVRDEVELEAAFTATINAQLRVGGLEETVTVSGIPPVVDVQSTQARTVLTKDQVDALPTGRSYQSIAATIPALGSQLAGRFDVGGATQMWQGTLVAYGARSGDFAVEVDGINTSLLLRTGDISGMYHNQSAFEDMVYQVVAGSAESQTGGVKVNMISKEGANRFSGEALLTYSNENFRSANIDADLQARGLTAAPNLKNIRDLNFSLGGPIKRDKVWFFFSPRAWGTGQYILNQFFPDGTPAADRSKIQTYTTRITAQIGQKHKITGMAQPETKYRQHMFSETGNYTLEGAPVQDLWSYIAQGKWTSTLSSRLLLEAGFSQTYLHQEYLGQPTLAGPSATNPYGAVSKADVGLGGIFTVFGSYPATGPLLPDARNIVASLSYVTGSHSIKVGMQDRFGNKYENYHTNGQLRQLYNRSVPFAVRLYNYPSPAQSNLNMDLGLYVQDSWRLGRLTFNPGLRYERFNGEVPAQTAPAGRFVAARSFDRIADLPNFSNWLLRVGGAYDVFGDGKTAVKGSFGRYMQQSAVDFQDLYNPMIVSTTDVAWTDLNGNDVADGTLGCVYLAPGCEINFAQMPRTFGVRRNRNPDPTLERPYQMVYNASLTRELKPGFGFSVNYYHRKYYDILYTRDTFKPFSAYTPYQIPDPRGNGQSLTVYNIDPAALQSLNEVDSTSPNNTSSFHSFDVLINARLGNGAFLQGGTSSGLTRARTCDVTDPNGNATYPNSLRFCDEYQFDIPWRTNFKLSGAYPLPYGVRLSAVFQSSAGDQVIQNYVVTAAAFRTMTGVTLNQASVNVRPLSEPGSIYYERINQLDFTVAKQFRVGSWRVTPDVSFFNLLNANPVYSQTLAWPLVGNPLRILDGRLVRFGVQARF